MLPNESQTSTDIISATVRFINSTASHIFLTGKAGTGKTTFLKNLAGKTHKQFAVVAPTGIAALNAGGATVHSQFLLPFGMFIPDSAAYSDFVTDGNYYTQTTLAKKHPMNSARKQVLRAIDLLVIDEVSMLRADLLDAIDYRMKAARGNFRQSFGGVQLLLIGDLYQLPPVVRRDEETQLKKYYRSPWFFEANALHQDGFVYIELDKIFRQTDDTFINLLNNLRNNKTTQDDIDLLNKHYKPSDEIQNLREVITLTTHNRIADELNQNALNELKASSHILKATIEGDFPENLYPVLQHIELKEGAQIMFTKNDSESKRYFNGKLATVTSIKDNKVEVSMAETHESYTLKKEVWENKKYTINTASQELDDEVMGTFEQYPIKLAWAITVHKSQGLTFDKAIIDVGQAFADGQVYVALSRLRSLDGLILRTHISPSVISTDKLIVNFSEQNNHPAELPEKTETSQRQFIRQLATKTFDFENLVKEISYIQHSQKESAGFEEKSMKPVLEQITNSLLNEKENSERFRRQMTDLLSSNDNLRFLERIKKGSAYYRAFIVQQLQRILQHIEDVRQGKRVKTYLNHLTELDQLFSKKWEELDKAIYLTEAILKQNDQIDFSELNRQRALERSNLLSEIQSQRKGTSKATKEKRPKKKSKTSDGKSTYDVTLQMLESGLSIEKIAEERDLVISTIEGHLAKAVAAGKLSVFKFLPEPEVESIVVAIKEMPEGFTSKDLYNHFLGKFGYGKLRAVVAHLKTDSKSSE